MAEDTNLRKIPILSIDVPSGWAVNEQSDWLDYEVKYQPAALLSLTAPKYCSLKLDSKAQHFLAGKEFLPDKLIQEFALESNNQFYQDDENVCLLPQKFESCFFNLL